MLRFCFLPRCPSMTVNFLSLLYAFLPTISWKLSLPSGLSSHRRHDTVKRSVRQCVQNRLRNRLLFNPASSSSKIAIRVNLNKMHVQLVLILAAGNARGQLPPLRPPRGSSRDRWTGLIPPEYFPFGSRTGTLLLPFVPPCRQRLRASRRGLNRCSVHLAHRKKGGCSRQHGPSIPHGAPA